MGERQPCEKCYGTGRVHRLRTADHILTDSPAWDYCPACGGKGTLAPVQADGGAHGSEPGGGAALNQATTSPPNVSEVG